MADNSFFDVCQPVMLSELAKVGGCEIRGDDKKVSGVAPLESAEQEDITFLSNTKYVKMLSNSKAGACILLEKYIDKAPDNMALLVSDNPYASYAKIANFFYKNNSNNQNISKNAYIDDTAKIGINVTIDANAVISRNSNIGDNTYIGPGVLVERGVKIGSNCSIGHNSTLSHCHIGDNVIIHPGVRIGQDGFGFATDAGRHIKVPQLGRVIIHNDVEIGANTCIDRGAGPDTIIGQNTKIDNLVQIGHNVQTGRGCIIVSQVGISGSTKLGDYVVIGGQAGIAGHLEIGNMVNIAAQSGVMSNISQGETIGGSPATPIKQWHRQTIALKKLVRTKRGSNE